MKTVLEILKIALIYFLSSYLSKVIILPTGLIGMIILFVCLNYKVIRLSEIEKVVEFILSHLAFFFVPLAVALVLDLHFIEEVFIEVLLVIVISTFLVMGCTGYVVEKFQRGCSK